jgi:hypothetical protein
VCMMALAASLAFAQPAAAKTVKHHRHHHHHHHNK